MKGARIRYQQTGEFHFLTFSCFRRRPYLSSGAAKDLFEDALERVRQRYLFAVATSPVPKCEGPGAPSSG
jgi:putative transposase